MFRNLLTALFPHNDRPTGKTVHRRPLTLEGLEDRSVPAIMVTTISDDPSDPGTTLREAMAMAHASPGPDSIQFAPEVSGTIHLTEGRLSIGYFFMDYDYDWGPVTIEGENRITLDAGNKSGVFEVQSGTVTLNGLTFTNGSDDLGGGLMIWDPASVTLVNSTISDSTARTAGGGIYNIGKLTLEGSTIANNYSGDVGGGIYVSGNWEGYLTVKDNSHITGNEARGYGGGIFNSGAVVTLENSWVTSNMATRKDGGGVYSNGTLVITGTVFDSNTGRKGGAIVNDGGFISISTSDFTNNVANSGDGDDLYITDGGTRDIDDESGMDIFVEGTRSKGGGRR